MSTGKHRSTSQKIRDRRRIADLYLQGETQIDIAEKVGISQGTVSRDIKFLQDFWLKSSLIDFDEAKSKELAKVDRLEREYWDAWERSCEDAESTTEKEIELDDRTIRKEATQTAKGQAGDPRFLAGVQWCIEKRCKILGLDAPIKKDVLNKELDLTKLTDEQLRRIAAGEEVTYVLATSG